MNSKGEQPGFTLVELLIVMGIISLLAGMVTPTLFAAKELARSTTCLTNLRALGASVALYHESNRGFFHPCHSGASYFWGTPTVPVDTTASPLLTYCDAGLRVFWCPSLPWGAYVPQGGVEEPTTTYGYNAWCLDPPFWWRTDDHGNTLPAKRTDDLRSPSELFVFADSAMSWSPGGVEVFQNSTSLDPVTLGSWGPNETPTTHFRHMGMTNALAADGRAASFSLEGGKMLDTEHQLGFVGADNVPHYDQ